MASRNVQTLMSVLFALSVAACSGGPSQTASTTSNPPAPATTGKVTVLLTDGPGPDWDQAIATINSIELIGESGHQTIFEGSSTVDLLSLPDYYEVFAIADDVLPGRYAKIRLFVESLELVELDDDGTELRRVAAHLVGNGKIDLNPRGDIVIASGDSLYIEIDFDMGRAFKSTLTGNGRVIVRPVIFVNVTRVPPGSRLTRLRGIVEEIDAANGEFLLCQQELVSEMRKRDDDDDEDEDEDEDEDDGDDGDGDGDGDDDEGDSRPCIDVTTDADTGIFGADGNPIEFAGLVVGDLATAVGHLRRDEEPDDDDDDDEDEEDEDNDEGEVNEKAGGGSGNRGDDDDHDRHSFDDDIVLHAVVVELGEDFLRAAGIVDTPVNGDVFDLALDPGQDLGTDEEVLSTQLFPGTRIFRKDGEELDIGAIVPGVAAVADGVLVQTEGTPDALRAALLILDPDLGSAEEALSGEIVSVNFDAGTLELLVGATTVCVNADDADIFLVSNADGFVSERVDLGDLEPTQQADVYGEGEDDAGCFLATVILASALPGNTLPVANAGPDATVAVSAPVNLTGNGSSDADGDPLSYLWSFQSVPAGSTATLSAANTAMASFVPNVAGSYVVALVVNDGLEDSAPDTVTITVQ